MNQNELKLSNANSTSNNDSRPIFLCHVYNPADFDNLFFNRKGFIFLGILKMNFTF